MDNNNTNKKTNENNLFGVSYEEAKQNADNQKGDLEIYNFTSSSPDFNILYGYEEEKNEEDEKKNKKKSLGNTFGIGTNEEKTDDLYKSSENILKDSNKNKGFFDIPLFSKKKNENDYEEMQENNIFNNTSYGMKDIDIENQKIKEDYERLKKILEQQNELDFHENKLQDNIEGSQGLFHGVPKESDYGNHQNYKQNLGVSNFGGSQNNFSNEEVKKFDASQKINENNYNFSPQNNFNNKEVENFNTSVKNNEDNYNFSSQNNFNNKEVENFNTSVKNNEDNYNFSPQNNFNNKEVENFNTQVKNNEDNYNFSPQNNFNNKEVENFNTSVKNNEDKKEFTHPIEEGNLEFYDDEFVKKNIVDDFSSTNNFNIDEIKMKNNEEANNFFEKSIEENKTKNLYNEQEFQNKKSIEEINIIKEKEEPMTIQDLDFYEDDGVSLGNTNFVEETLENPKNVDQGSLDTYEDNGETLENSNNKSNETLEDIEIFNEPMKIEDLDLDINFDLEQLNNPIYKEEKNISDLYNENKKIENTKPNINLDEFRINELKLELYGDNYEENKFENKIKEKIEPSFLEEDIYNKKTIEENKFENIFEEKIKEKIEPSFLEEDLNSDIEKLKEKINSHLYEKETFEIPTLEKNHIFIEEIEDEKEIEELKMGNFENKLQKISSKKIKDLFVEDVELKYLILKEFTNKNLD